MARLVDIITAPEPATRDRPLDAACAPLGLAELLAEAAELDRFRRRSDNLYQRVRALMFLYAIHRFHLPARLAGGRAGAIPFKGYANLLGRRFGEALAAAYRGLAFQTLADQVRRSVRAVRGNQWMFRMGHPADYPLRLRPELLRRDRALFPVLRETTPVRMDLSHSGWSDIFFPRMDYPEGAASSTSPSTSRCTATASPRRRSRRGCASSTGRCCGSPASTCAPRPRSLRLAEVFDFARDYLGLLKAAVIASGIVPPGMEGSGQSPRGSAGPPGGRPAWGSRSSARSTTFPRARASLSRTNLLACLISAACGPPGRSLPHWPAGRGRAPASCRARDPRRMARRQRRRLAGFRRRLAGHQADLKANWPPRAMSSSASAAAACCRAIDLSARRGQARNPRPACRTARAGAWRHGAGCRPDPGDGHRKVPAALRARNGPAARKPSRLLDRSWRPQERRCARHRRAHQRNFDGPDPDHHPLGGQPLHRLADRAGARPFGATSGASGCSAAWPAAAWASSSPPNARPRARISCSP
jgi:hypothetical protein